MFVKLTARLIVNAHELNNEASVGTFTDIRKIKLISSKGEVGEFTAVSGNMLKHYHFVYLKRLLEQMGYGDKFCRYCKREESWRLASEDERLVKPAREEVKGKKASEKMEASLNKLAESEEKIITSCAIEDVHGYLSPVPGFPMKRDSRVRFSWLVPVEDSEEAIATVIHNRVAKVMELKPEEKAEKEKKEEKAPAQMMAFYKQYASAVYSFNSSIDLGRIGISDYTMRVVDCLGEDELKARKLAALKAYVPILLGEAGASMSRALPIVEPLECLIIASEFPALPNLVSSYYSNYNEENLKLLKGLQGLVTETIHIIGGPSETYQNLKSAFASNDKMRFIEAESPIDAINKLVELVSNKAPLR
jgi:CRISPR-associated protein Cst2